MSISQTEVVLELLKEVNRDNVTRDRRYSMFAITSRGKWIQDLVMHNSQCTIGFALQQITLISLRQAIQPIPNPPIN